MNWRPARAARRHPTLEHEHAIAGQVPGGVLEAADLVVLGEQVPDGVEHQVDQPIGVTGGGRGHVAHGHLHLVAARLLAHPVDHVLGQLDAIHAHAGRPQRQGDAPGTTANSSASLPLANPARNATVSSSSPRMETAS